LYQLDQTLSLQTQATLILHSGSSFFLQATQVPNKPIFRQLTEYLVFPQQQSPTSNKAHPYYDMPIPMKGIRMHSLPLRGVKVRLGLLRDGSWFFLCCVVWLFSVDEKSETIVSSLVLAHRSSTGPLVVGGAVRPLYLAEEAVESSVVVGGGWLWCSVLFLELVFCWRVKAQGVSFLFLVWLVVEPSLTCSVSHSRHLLTRGVPK
jgi:hypothetical protein